MATSLEGFLSLAIKSMYEGHLPSELAKFLFDNMSTTLSLRVLRFFFSAGLLHSEPTAHISAENSAQCQSQSLIFLRCFGHTKTANLR